MEISSSNFPRFDRNLNTGDPIGDDASPRVARQHILQMRRTRRTSCCRSSLRREIADWEDCWRIRSAQRAAQERQAFLCQRVLRLRQRAPDRRGAGDGLVCPG